MKAHYEKVLYDGSSFRAFLRADSEFRFYWHYHPEFELTLILESSGQRLVGDGIDDYGPGDLVLLGPNLPHSWRSGRVKPRIHRIHRALVFQFRQDFLGDQFFLAKEMQSIVHLLKRAASGLAFGHTSRGEAVARRLRKFYKLSPVERLLMLVSVLGDLSAETKAKKLSTDRVRPMCRLKDQQRIDAICMYLNQHYDDKIDFDNVAERFHMEQSSLCRFFKRATGRTMTTYLNEYRVGAAGQLLVETETSLLDIAFRVGFGNYSNFHRQFKRIKGYSPRVLRQQFQPNRLLQQPVSTKAFRDNSDRASQLLSY